MGLKGYVALMREALDARLRSGDDLARLRAGTLIGSIPHKLRSRDLSLSPELHRDDSRGDAFARLWADLRFAQIDDPNPAVLVTSAQAKEGKTSTSISLAITAARAGSRVALVDVNLRKPTVASTLGLENSAGLTTVLLGHADVSELFQPWGSDDLCVLTAGGMLGNPRELLDSRAMRTLMVRLNEEFDTVILDGPPVLPGSGALMVARNVGQVLLVAAVGEVRLNRIEDAVRALSAAEVPTGIVLNKVPRSDGQRAYPRPPHCPWTAEYVHPAFPEDLRTTTTPVRSQS